MFSPSAVPPAGPCCTVRRRDAACAGVHFESQDVETNEEKGQENKPKQMSQKRRKGALGLLSWKSVQLDVGVMSWSPM